jgi:ribulose 1,5-bisphosphate synthetase/thiazole synthase
MGPIFGGMLLSDDGVAASLTLALKEARAG